MDEMNKGFQGTLNALRSLHCTVCKERWHTPEQGANAGDYTCVGGFVEFDELYNTVVVSEYNCL